MCANGEHSRQGEGGVNGGLERQDWRTQEKRDREDSWEMVWLFRVEGIILTHADRWPSSQHCPWTLQAPGVVPLPQTGSWGVRSSGPCLRFPIEKTSVPIWGASRGPLSLASTPPTSHRSDKTVTPRNLSELQTCAPRPTAAAALQAASLLEQSLLPSSWPLGGPLSLFPV